MVMPTVGHGIGHGHRSHNRVLRSWSCQYWFSHSLVREKTGSDGGRALGKILSNPPGEEVSTKTNTNGNTGVKKIRGAAAARNHRDKEVRDRQKEIAAKRVEAARKREARSARRRGEGKTACDHALEDSFCHHPHRKSHPALPNSILIAPIGSPCRSIITELTDIASVHRTNPVPPVFRVIWHNHDT
jgi:hypothetical protein